MDIGKKIIKQLKKEISDSEYDRYIKHLKYDKENSKDNLVIFESPNIYTAKWINTKYSKKIANIFESIEGIKPNIHITIHKVKKDRVINSASQLYKDTKIKSTHLNPSFRFDSFIIGSSNQFAYTIAKNTAQKPGILYNPLFLYGGVGLGKTHLLQAIGNYRKDLGDSVIYTSIEQFMNKFISSIKSNTMDKFRETFRNCDILLIDDIQFLSGKEQTQEELFHTFNELHANNKQVVVTSDREPRKIEGLVDRLRNRFEMGLMADIKPPELETKIAIIEKKCELDGINLSKEIINYIATHMGENIREIEGTIIKLNALSTMLNQEITPEFAKNAIKDQLKEQEENITIDNIVKIVARELNVKPSDIKSKKRNRNVVNARRIIIYLARNLTPNSMPQIAVYFGMKDHTAISYNMKKITEAIKKDEDFRILLEELSNKIGNRELHIE